jgi:hypothetical protein
VKGRRSKVGSSRRHPRLEVAGELPELIVGLFRRPPRRTSSVLQIEEGADRFPKGGGLAWLVSCLYMVGRKEPAAVSVSISSISLVLPTWTLRWHTRRKSIEPTKRTNDRRRKTYPATDEGVLDGRNRGNASYFISRYIDIDLLILNSIKIQ